MLDTFLILVSQIRTGVHKLLSTGQIPLSFVCVNIWGTQRCSCVYLLSLTALGDSDSVIMGWGCSIPDLEQMHRQCQALWSQLTGCATDLPCFRLAIYYTELGFEVVPPCFPFSTKQGSLGKLQFKVLRSSQCSLRVRREDVETLFPGVWREALGDS